MWQRWRWQTLTCHSTLEQCSNTTFSANDSRANKLPKVQIITVVFHPFGIWLRFRVSLWAAITTYHDMFQQRTVAETERNPGLVNHPETLGEKRCWRCWDVDDDLFLYFPSLALRHGWERHDRAKSTFVTLVQTERFNVFGHGDDGDGMEGTYTTCSTSIFSSRSKALQVFAICHWGMPLHLHGCSHLPHAGRVRDTQHPYKDWLAKPYCRARFRHYPLLNQHVTYSYS